jgi:hypothetical protein
MNFRTGYLLLLPALLFAVVNVQAHDPFDGSTHMTVRADDIELSVTFGTDAARRVLSIAGFSNEQISELFKPRGPRGLQTLPVSVAANFFAIRAGDETLTARRATLLYEGMEVIFTLIYPRAPTGELEVRAVYYETIPEMRRGSFVAYDEDTRQLGAALFSQSSFTTHVSSPRKITGDSTALKSASVSKIPTPELSAPQPSFAESKLGPEHIVSGSNHQLLLVATFVVVLVSGCWLLKRRSSPSEF